MRRHIAIAGFIGFELVAVSAHAQTNPLDPTKFRALQTQYEQLAVRYQEKCKSTMVETELKLLNIEQGAGLAGGLIFPITTEIVTVLRNLQKQVTDDMCERATEYADLAQAIGNILKQDSAR